MNWHICNMTLISSAPPPSRSVSRIAERIAWLLVDAVVADELGCRLDAAAIIGDVAAEPRSRRGHRPLKRQIQGAS
jgi:hypothetical protein